MWSDRLIDGQTTGIGEWEASKNGTAAARQSIPKDVLLCDWHYESAHPTMLAFALDGFEVLTAPWRQPAVGVRQLDLIRLGRAEASPEVAARLRGMLQTTWGPFARVLGGVLEGWARQCRGAGRGAVLPRGDAAGAAGVEPAGATARV